MLRKISSFGFHMCLVLLVLTGVACKDPPLDRVTSGDGIDESYVTLFESNSGYDSFALEPGALAGSWAYLVEGWQQQELPVLGWEDTGGQTYYLAEWTWDEDTQAYSQSLKACGGLNFEVANQETWIDPEVYQTLPEPINYFIDVDHGLGRIELIDVWEGWGITFDDPINEEFPGSIEDALVHYGTQDPENDGHPGYRSELRGLCDVSVQNISLSETDYVGQSISNDHWVGIFDDATREFISISYEGSCLLGDPTGTAERRKIDDKMRNYIEAIRVPVGSTCETVLSEVENGEFCPSNPMTRPARTMDCQGNQARQ